MLGPHALLQSPPHVALALRRVVLTIVRITGTTRTEAFATSFFFEIQRSMLPLVTRSLGLGRQPHPADAALRR
jgi:hypothetical protein